MAGVCPGAGGTQAILDRHARMLWDGNSSGESGRSPEQPTVALEHKCGDQMAKRRPSPGAMVLYRHVGERHCLATRRGGRGCTPVVTGSLVGAPGLFCNEPSHRIWPKVRNASALRQRETPELNQYVVGSRANLPVKEGSEISEVHARYLAPIKKK